MPMCPLTLKAALMRYAKELFHNDEEFLQNELKHVFLIINIHTGF